MRIVKIGFIGMDNTGNVILNGLFKIHGPEETIFSTTRQDKMEVVTVRTKASHAHSNREHAEAVKYLILVVRPQYFDAVLSEIKDVVTPEQVVISPAPGITISDTMECPEGNVRVVRATSNIPAILGEGMISVPYGGAFYIEEEKETIRDIFPSYGRVKLVEERLMDVVDCISGSSPAFVYMFIEVLADSGVKYGLPREIIYTMAAQTVLGSAKMIPEISKHPGQSKGEVYSSGGTTVVGVSILGEYGLRNAVIRAVDACYEKARHIKQDNDIKS